MKLPRPGPINRPPITGGDPPRKNGGDPYIAYSLGGALYVGMEPSAQRQRPGFPFNLPDSDIALAYSGDGGKTFSVPQVAGTPVDRPWLTVDSTTGTVYTVSSGDLNMTTGTHNIPGGDAINDRWVVAWEAGLTGKSEPRRIGGPDFAATAGSSIAAAHGVVAMTFVLGPPTFFLGPESMRPPVNDAVPDSLRDIVQDDRTECSVGNPCLFFET